MKTSSRRRKRKHLFSALHLEIAYKALMQNRLLLKTTAEGFLFGIEFELVRAYICVIGVGESGISNFFKMGLVATGMHRGV